MPMKTIDTQSRTIATYNHEAEEALAFVQGDVKSSHLPKALQSAANDNQQLTFSFMGGVVEKGVVA